MTPDDFSAWVFDEMAHMVKHRDSPLHRGYAHLHALLSEKINPHWTYDNPDNQNFHKWSLSSMAAQARDPLTIHLLAAQGVDFNTPDPKGGAPLNKAFDKQDPEGRVEDTILAMLAVGAKPENVSTANNTVQFPLVLATFYKLLRVMQALIDATKDSPTHADSLKAAIPVALSPEALKLLLQAGAVVEPDIVHTNDELHSLMTRKSRTPITVDTTYTLPDTQPLDAIDLGRWAYNLIIDHPQTSAERQTRLKRLQYLMEKGVKPNWRHPQSTTKNDGTDGFSLAMTAAWARDTDVIALLAQYGVSFHTQDNGKTSPLMFALDWLPREDRNASITQTVTALINLTGDVTSGAPLVMAAKHGHIDAMHVLIAAKAPLEHTNAIGETPLAAAVASGNIDAVNILLAAGASAQCKNPKTEETLLQLAARVADQSPAGAKVLQTLHNHVFTHNLSHLKAKRPPKPFGPK